MTVDRADVSGAAVAYLAAHPGDWFSRAQVLGMLSQHAGAAERVNVLWAAPWVRFLLPADAAYRYAARCLRCRATILFPACEAALFNVIDTLRQFHQSHAQCLEPGVPAPPA